MCNLSEGIEKRGINIGKAEERDNITVKYVQALMRKSGLTIDAAMDILEVSEADRSRYAEIIEKAYTDKIC